jgi:hypothetical protein
MLGSLSKPKGILSDNGAGESSVHLTHRVSFIICVGAGIALAAGCNREPLEAESRDLGSFESVNLHGAASIHILVGESATLKIEGTEYAVKKLRTEVSDGTLTLHAQKSGWAWFGDRDELKLTIGMPKLTHLDSNGAGSIVISHLNGGDQTVRIAGAHNIVADGQLDSVRIELDGAGNVDYGKVTAKSAEVTVNGAGHVLVKSTERLKGTVNGVGAIQYRGDPQKVESEIHGIGTVGRE